MRKFIKPLLLASLLIASLTLPNQVSANTYDTNAHSTDYELNVETRFISVVLYYDNFPPSTYYYQSGGWVGTLSRVSYYPTSDGRYAAHYAGQINRTATPLQLKSTK